MEIVTISDSDFSIDLFITSIFGNIEDPIISLDLKLLLSIIKLSFSKSTSKKGLHNFNFVTLENFFAFPL